MAGIYIHIPFCKKACHYCDFYFSTTLLDVDVLVASLKKEIELKSLLLKKEEIQTLYFGGGTPSILTADQIGSVLESIQTHANCNKNMETTLEINPENSSLTYLYALKSLGINRLSIGIQTFDDKTLKFLNRNHSGETAKKILEEAKEVGFSSLSADLIYGIPNRSTAILKEDIKTLLSYQLQHLSCYMLTIEPKTVFHHWVEKKKMSQIDEDFVLEQYDIVLEMMKQNQFENYEISNFCLPSFEAKHNQNYWNFIDYIGIGPSASSLIGNVRYKNISHIKKYMEAVQTNKTFHSIEKLSLQDQMNEYIMLKMRLKEGILFKDFYKRFQTHFQILFKDEIKKWETEKYIDGSATSVKLTPKGKKIINSIVLDFFM